MGKLAVPFNVSIMHLTPEKLQGMKPVRVLDSFDNTGVNFHEDGLFSTTIFGRVGDPQRSSRFSYIDIKAPIMHPILFRAYGDLKQLYHGIMSGQEYALFSDEVGDFVRSDAINGRTGYAFFAANVSKIVFEATKSTSREHNIKLVTKYAKEAFTSKILVLPAGLRDMEQGADGRPQEDEINTLYRKLLAISNTINDAAVRQNIETINNSRWGLQQTFNAIYSMIEDMLQGKRKLIQNRWASRRIFNGTRNVITSLDASVHYLGAPGTISFTDTGIGLYQALKAILPVAIYQIKTGFLSRVFQSRETPAVLVNKKTLKKESVNLHSKYYDQYMTEEGIAKVLTMFAQEDVRHRYLELDGYYMGLIYKGPDGTFKLIQDIGEVPEGRNVKDVTPLTFCELLYLSVYENINRYPLYITRYPVQGMGSIYPSKMFVRTTIQVETRKELGPNWEPMDDKHIAYQFPIREGAFVNSLMPHGSRLDRLGADFDGDTCSGNALYTEDGVQEVDDYMKKASAFVDTSGKFLASTDIVTVQLVMHNLTGDPQV